MNKLFLVITFFLSVTGSVSAQQFKVTYPAAAFNGPFTGHVILYLSKTSKEPRKEIDQPCYGKIVKAVKPNQVVVFDNKAIFFPVQLTKLERGNYYVQVVWDRNLGGRNIGTSAGNMYSKTIQIDFTDDTTQVIRLVCDQVVAAPVFVNSKFDKELKAPSKLLTNFHHKTTTVDAAVIVPDQYFTETSRKFPVVFNIAGYGAEYHHYSKENGDTSGSSPADTTACIKVYLDGSCSWGHSVYANSNNNGPWGDALVKEFIPQLEKLYRCNGALLLKGHSSGGWASLWLQTHYPKVFAGCNASAPDYVDFRNVAKRNVYKDTTKHPQLGNKAHKPHVEDVLYRGAQQVSFMAVYGLKGANGYPRSLYDQVTGYIDPVALQHWKQYDISYYLRTNWPRLKKDLAGKVRISVGNEDTYQLNLSIEKMEEAMKEIGAEVTFAYYPGDHGSVVTNAYRHDQDLWLENKYHEWQKLHAHD